MEKNWTSDIYDFDSARSVWLYQNVFRFEIAVNDMKAMKCG